MRRLVYLPFQPAPAGLQCDRVSVQSIAEAVGTPAYVYSARAIRAAFAEIDTAFAGYPHAIH
jgi:diaminopimelate decarboxylase